MQDERGYDVFIPVKEASAYITEEFCTALEVFRMTETLECLPFAGGWAEQPEWIVQALTVLKIEKYKVDEEERELKRQSEEDARKYGKR